MKGKEVFPQTIDRCPWIDWCQFSEFKQQDLSVTCTTYTVWRFGCLLFGQTAGFMKLFSESINWIFTFEEKNYQYVFHIDESHIIVHPNVLLPLALKCPPNNHYNPCSSACPQPSCQNPAGSSGSCQQPCVEGCVCNPGLVLSGDKCVPVSECGCTDEDGKYQPVSVLRRNAGGGWFF